MKKSDEFPEDFQDCVRFHGHVCPGLAIGYAAVKAGIGVLGVSRSEDEEIVAIVENDSCAVDAVQVLLGCTFGKGNLVFRDWGKQVFTFFDRKTGRAVRVSLKDQALTESEQRRALKKKIDSGKASPSDRQLYDEIRRSTIQGLIQDDPADHFEITRVEAEMPPEASIVSTKPCDICRESTVVTRLKEKDGRLVCLGCLNRDS
jgi:formylmethanofuran dehydrogenase subunit E